MDRAKRLRVADRVLCAVLCAGLALLTCCLLADVALRGGDLSIHTAWASEMDLLQPRSIVRHVVHFLWHLPVGLLVRLGMDSTLAACLITALWKIGQFLLLRRWLLWADEGRGQAIFATLWAFAGVCCMSLCWPGQVPGGYFNFLPSLNGEVNVDIIGSPNVWHSPTQIASTAMALLAMPCLVRLLRDYEQARAEQGPAATLPWRRVAVLAVWLALGVLTKPTFLQAFLPGAGVYGLWLLARRYRGAGRFFGQILLAFVPALLVFGLCYLYYGGVISPYGSGLLLSFSGARLLRGLRGLLLMSAFPLAVLGVAGKGRLRGNHAVWLALGMALFSLLEYALFEEAGLRGADGNMGWAMMSASALLWAAALPVGRDALRGLRARGVAPWRWLAAGACGALLVWHLVSCVRYLIYYFGTDLPL